MNTTEFENSNREKGIFGPDPQEIEELNQLKGPIGKSRFDNIFRGVGAVLGFFGFGATLEACAPPQQTETIPVQTSTSTPESAKLVFQTILYPVEARDPQNENNKVNFKFIETKTDKGSAYKISLKENTPEDYSVFISADSNNQTHLEYKTLKDGKPDFAFLDYTLDLKAPKAGKEEPDFGQKAQETWQQGRLTQVKFADGQNTIIYDVRKDQNILNEILALLPQALSTKIAAAAELPKPTPTESPKPTATATKEPTPTPSSLTAENFNEFVSIVSNEEFQKLAKSQPDAFAFPVIPKSGDFQITYINQPTSTSTSLSTKENYKSILINSSDLLLVSAIDGEVKVWRDDHFDKERITRIGVIKKITDNINLVQGIRFVALGGRMSLTDNIDISHTERGSKLATASGKFYIDIILVERLAEPIIIHRPDGGRTDIFSYGTYLTPSIFESSGWVSQDGKAVTLQK